MKNSITYTEKISYPLLVLVHTKKINVASDVLIVNHLPQICVSNVLKTELVNHIVNVKMDTMKMVQLVLYVEKNVLLVLVLMLVLLVLETESDLLMDVFVLLKLTILVKKTVHHVQMLVKIVI